MKERQIRKLIEIVEESEVEELEIRNWWLGQRIRISKRASMALISNGAAAPVQHIALSGSTPESAAAMAGGSASGHAAADAGAEAPAEAEASWSEDRYHIIKSPIVGTFYRAPAPDAPAYVKEGESIKAGQVVCIVEAMKLMNEIQAEKGGKVVKIMMGNAEPVEYNQRLIVIDPEG
jgi:acetyl-CoA carboxylase biotin carboxyl carrier protein